MHFAHLIGQLVVVNYPLVFKDNGHWNSLVCPLTPPANAGEIGISVVRQNTYLEYSVYRVAV